MPVDEHGNKYIDILEEQAKVGMIVTLTCPECQKPTEYFFDKKDMDVKQAKIISCCDQEIGNVYFAGKPATAKLTGGEMALIDHAYFLVTNSSVSSKEDDEIKKEWQPIWDKLKLLAEK